MKLPSTSLNRLFTAAKSVSLEPVPEMPPSFPTRVLALVRQRARLDDPLPGLIPLFRRAFALGMAIMFVAIAWSYADPIVATDDEAIANFEVRADVLP